MAKEYFSPAEWSKILQANPEQFGLPKRRSKSVVIGSFNIREFSDPAKRSQQANDFILSICERFDLLAIQEVGDNLAAIKQLKDNLGNDYGMVVSDVTGVYPGSTGNSERLAFLFNWKRIERTELASDITIDRTKVYQTLLDHHQEICLKLKSHNEPVSKLSLPQFITFVRTPHCASFRIRSLGSAEPIELLSVNAHLLYGKNKTERKEEFYALIEWLSIRAKKVDRTYHKNLLLLGDCNLDFASTGTMRDSIDQFLKELNSTVLKSKKAAKANFPLLSEHPEHGYIKTSARKGETYDQIGLFHHDDRLPDYTQNAAAGTGDEDDYDYGAFRFTDMISNALYGDNYDKLDKTKQKYIIKRCEWDISDHLPVWMRIRIPE